MKRLLEKLKNTFSSKPFFLVLLPVFFIYSGYNELFGFLTLKFVLFNYVIIQLVILLLYYASSRLLKNKEKGAVVTILISLFTLTYGYIHDTIKSLNIFPAVVTSFTLILPLICLLFASIFFFVKKRRNGTTLWYDAKAHIYI